MAYDSLAAFVARLEASNQLIRINAPVSAELEITEIVDRVSKGPEVQNKALLFERVTRYDMPVLINMFGSAQRMAWALGVDELEDLHRNLAELLDMTPPTGLRDVLSRGTALAQALRHAGLKPRKVPHPPAQAIVETEHPTLDTIPILTCWPQDGGPFVTLPQVITRDPVKGTRNVGMYRLQKIDAQTLLVHWQRHKGGAEHERIAQEQAKPRIPAAIVLGGDPACIWAASAPLPPDIDEYWLAGWLRGRAVPFCDCITQPLEVPATADIVIEGYVDPNEHRPEGPFGDHTGYYTPVELFPVFHVTAITRRIDPIYPATVVGIPPMEDYWMGKATERLFLPLAQLIVPEIVDFAMPAPGLFHNLVLVSIKKRYPGHARKVIHALWGLALLSLAKAIVIVDEWVDVQNPTETAWQALGNVDWSRDVMVADGPVDQLDHAAPFPAFGGKIGIDATAKLPEEGHGRGWPEVARMDPSTKARVDALWGTLGLD
ncbi:MAG: menaquinone biosynthesis decarboxylase [Anaerolineae bacterium]|nr:menaquinone biosynthesis decarboxylase [Anaerolineae bacterium]